MGPAREFSPRGRLADLIREVPELHHPTWHHRDFYWGQDRGRAIDLPDLRVHPENLLERLHYFKKRLANPTVPARERAIGIVWVLHLVGDVHQPFHCSARVTAIERKGDHGGQEFALRPGSLHIPRESSDCVPHGTTFPIGCAPGSGDDPAFYLQRAAASSCPSSAGHGGPQAGTLGCVRPGIGRRRPQRLSG
jgi:hypothetical protein